MEWINELLNGYYRFLEEKTLLNEASAEGWVQIRTPFIGLFNDGVDLYAKREGEKIILSDDGETINRMKLAGVDFSRSGKREAILDQILLNYGIDLIDNELKVETSQNSFAQVKLNMISAINEINDLIVLSKPTVTSLFQEDVKFFLNEQNIIYTSPYVSMGSTGIYFNFDFQIAYKDAEIVIKSFNALNQVNLSHFLFSWEDVREFCKKQSGKNVIGLTIVNDSKEVKKEFLEALDRKKARCILWSERSYPENIMKLKAA